MSDTLMPPQPIDVLQIMNVVNATAAPWNEYSVPLARRQHIVVCSFRPSEPGVASATDGVTLIEGDGTVRGFFRNLQRIAASYELANIHVHAPLVGLLFLVARLLDKRLRNPKSIYTVHSSIPLYHQVYQLLMLPIMVCYRHVVFCSQASLDACPKLHAWLAGRRKLVIRNGVNLERIARHVVAEGEAGETSVGKSDAKISSGDDSERADIPEEKLNAGQTIRIIWVGRLIALKRAELLIDAVRECDNMHVEFVGRGPLLEKLENRVAVTGLSHRIQFIGAVPRHEVYERLQTADVFVSTSSGEGMPIAVLEAMALSRPVFLSAIPSHREINDVCSSARLVDMSVSALPLQNALEEFAAQPFQQRKEAGLDCRHAMEQNFSLKVMLDRYAELYAATNSADEHDTANESSPSAAQQKGANDA